MMNQDIDAKQGFALVDPHGDLAASIVKAWPANKYSDLLHLDVASLTCCLGFNPLKKVAQDKRSLVASGVIEILRKLNDSKSWGVKMEHILRNVLLTLLDQDKADFSDIPRILLDKEYRKQCISQVTNSEVEKFWTGEFDKYHPFQRANAVAPILNKVGAFLSNPILKKILVDNKRQVSFRQAMDEGKTVIINLSKGSIGEDATTLLGGLLLNAIGLASFSRVNIPEESRRPFMVYVDEFQSFSTLSLANMLSELRKYGVGLILANQFLSQLNAEIKDAVLGNVGTTVAFRLGISDAKYMAGEFYPTFSFSDLTSLPNYRIYLKLMIDGVPSKPFSAKTLSGYASMVKK